MKKSKKRVIPGFGLTMGVTITMLSIIVLIPLASLVVYSAWTERVFRSNHKKKSIVQLLRKFYHSTWCITGQRCDGTDSCLGAGAL